MQRMQPRYDRNDNSKAADAEINSQDQNHDRKKQESEWKLEIHQLDVGQGDSALVLFKKLNPETKKFEVDKSILIDGGKGFNDQFLRQTLFREFQYSEDEDSKNRLSQLETKETNHNNLLSEFNEPFTTINQKRHNIKRTINTAEKAEKKAYGEKKEGLKEKIKDNKIKLSEKEKECEEITKEQNKIRTEIKDLYKNFSPKLALSAIIISHEDIDHYDGITKLIESGEIFLFVNKDTKFIISAGKQNGEDIIYSKAEKIFQTFANLNQINQDQLDHHIKQGIIFAYNYIGDSIWRMFSNGNDLEGSLNGTRPDIQFLASDGEMEQHDKEDLHDKNKRLTIAARTDDNASSIVSIISLGKFKYYTAGDFKNNTTLIESLKQKEGGTNLSIPALLVPHHGARGHIDQRFLEISQTRAAIISHGNAEFHGSYHPNHETLQDLTSSKTDHIYLTHPKFYPNEHSIMPSDRVIIAGVYGATSSDTKNKSPRGSVKVETFGNIAPREKFLIEYENQHSQTRDYFKNKNFDQLKDLIINIINNKIGNFNGRKLTLHIAQEDLQYFYDQDSKIKHLNPSTLQKFFNNYRERAEESNYTLEVEIQDNKIILAINNSKFNSPYHRFFFKKQRFDTKEERDNVLQKIVENNPDGLCKIFFNKKSDILNDDGTLKTLLEHEILEDGPFYAKCSELGEKQIHVDLYEKHTMELRKEYIRSRHEERSDDHEKPKSFSSKTIARRTIIQNEPNI